MGSNSNEGAGFVPWSPSGPGAAALYSATQSIIACPLAVEVKYVITSCLVTRLNMKLI